MKDRKNNERRPLIGYPSSRGGTVVVDAPQRGGELPGGSPEKETDNVLTDAKQAIKGGLELHPSLAGLTETRCSEAMYRTMAHIVLDTVLDGMFEKPAQAD